jgi:hypothetical protein
MARQKRSLVAEKKKQPKKRKRVIFQKRNFQNPGHERPGSERRKGKGYHGLAEGSGNYKKGGYVSSRKDRAKRHEAMNERKGNKKTEKYLELLDKKKRRKEAKSAIKKVCETTSGKQRRKINLDPNTIKARNHAVRGKDQYGICHKRSVKDKEKGYMTS